ncbi:hypothetical protein [Nonomuraea jabiensis]|uniref:hypothetical protein n=1 Tax=Nonomuraea jabiensis TaxID=882448 RepID=UPI003D711F3C
MFVESALPAGQIAAHRASFGTGFRGGNGGLVELLPGGGQVRGGLLQVFLQAADVGTGLMQLGLALGQGGRAFLGQVAGAGEVLAQGSQLLSLALGQTLLVVQLGSELTDLHTEAFGVGAGVAVDTVAVLFGLTLGVEGLLPAAQGRVPFLFGRLARGVGGAHRGPGLLGLLHAHLGLGQLGGDGLPYLLQALVQLAQVLAFGGQLGVALVQPGADLAGLGGEGGHRGVRDHRRGGAVGGPAGLVGAQLAAVLAGAAALAWLAFGFGRWEPPPKFLGCSSRGFSALAT